MDTIQELAKLQKRSIEIETRLEKLEEVINPKFGLVDLTTGEIVCIIPELLALSLIDSRKKELIASFEESEEF